MLTAFLVLPAFYLGGAVASALFAVSYARVFGLLRMLGGRSVARTVAKVALCWPVDVYRLAFPRVPGEGA